MSIAAHDGSSSDGRICILIAFDTVTPSRERIVVTEVFSSEFSSYIKIRSLYKGHISDSEEISLMYGDVQGTVKKSEK